MHISIIQFENQEGKTYRRGVGMIMSSEEFHSAILHGFGELNVDELFLQLGGENADSYSKSIQQDIFNKYMELSTENADMLYHRQVHVVSPVGETLFKFTSDLVAKEEN